MVGLKRFWFAGLAMAVLLTGGLACGDKKKPTGAPAGKSPSSKPESFSDVKLAWSDFEAKLKGNVVAAGRKWVDKYKENSELTIVDFQGDLRKEVSDEEIKKDREKALREAPDVGELKFKTHEQMGNGFFEDYSYAIKFTRSNRNWVFKEGKVKLLNSQKKEDPRLGQELPMTEKDLEDKYFPELLGLK